MNQVKHAVARFAFRLYRCTLGEDLTEKSSALSNGAKVAIACTTATAAAGGATSLANSSNKAGDEASSKINKTVGASADKAESVQSPFK